MSVCALCASFLCSRPPSTASLCLPWRSCGPDLGGKRQRERSQNQKRGRKPDPRSFSPYFSLLSSPSIDGLPGLGMRGQLKRPWVFFFLIGHLRVLTPPTLFLSVLARMSPMYVYPWLQTAIPINLFLYSFCTLFCNFGRETSKQLPTTKPDQVLSYPDPVASALFLSSLFLVSLNPGL